jgi:hypothetical protein
MAYFGHALTLEADATIDFLQQEFPFKKSSSPADMPGIGNAEAPS